MSAPDDQRPISHKSERETSPFKQVAGEGAERRESNAEKKEENEDIDDNAVIDHALFCEFFAGEGVLTAGVKLKGVPAATPEDVASGGLDFRHASTVDIIKTRLRNIVAEGTKVMLHLAPPCATFSRARDRSYKTRLRSKARPQGLLGKTWWTKEANVVATRARELAEWAAKELGCAVSMENPRSSYLWSFLQFDNEVPYEDYHFSPCRFGSDVMKPTKLRCWNWSPTSLEATCTLKDDEFTCGRKRLEGHTVLEFGSRKTSEAATYAPGVVTAWAKEVRKYFKNKPSDETVARSAVLQVDGRVHRHVLRGEDTKSAKEKREAEDLSCKAGMRNAGWFEHELPHLWRVMAVVAKVLLDMRSKISELRGLSACCGSAPSREPPTKEALKVVRAVLAEVMDVVPDEFEKHNAASTWRPFLVKKVVELTEDTDLHISDWLWRGAPMGITRTIEAGGWFPNIQEQRQQNVDDLDAKEARPDNHRSFEELHGEDTPPAWKLIDEQVNSGAAYLFKDLAHAEEVLGDKVHPAPLGNVVKDKEDGTKKHRLIQDQRVNEVNTAVLLPERQVLPRGVDRGADLAHLAWECDQGEDVATLVLDFKDAFMSLPLWPTERRFNCARAGHVVKRDRDALFDEEPAEGEFVVWRVLGFGGRPNPLIFARVASFACRTAQALLGPWTKVDRDGQWQQVGRGLLQCFVDDPALVVAGTPDQREAAVDLVILWWLCLGIPLAWKKGELHAGPSEHRWIGIMYTLRDKDAVMTLPKAYVEELLVLIGPLCSPVGTVELSTLDVIIGKAARVAHVVPAARPFVAGLWGALAAVQKTEASGQREAPPGKAPSRRFCYAASWVRALLAEEESCPLPLERVVRAVRPKAASTSGWRAEFDASIFGGGAILRDPSGSIVEYFAVVWWGDEANHLGVHSHDTKYQSFWEFATLLLVLMVWGDRFVKHSLAILGDNTAALQNALSLKGRGPLLAVAREVSWRKARRSWCFEVGHLPSESNTIADCLSRVADPKGKGWPSEALASAAQAAPPRLRDLWIAAPQ